MKDSEQDDWMKLIIMQSIETAEQNTSRLSMALHLAFLVKFLSSFLNNSFFWDLDLQVQNCVNPDIACGFEIHKQPPPPQSDSIMFNRIPLKRLSGYPTEDAEIFIKL